MIGYFRHAIGSVKAPIYTIASTFAGVESTNLWLSSVHGPAQ